MAAVVAFLASDDAEYLTGISVPVDGGLTMGWFRPIERAAGAGSTAPGSAAEAAA